MTQKDNGGAAFPACNDANVNGAIGMTLRDYFAGQALAGIMSNCDESGAPEWALYPRRAAALAYETADAMLKARAAHD